MNDKQLGFNFDTESLESAADLKQAEEEKKIQLEKLTNARESLKSGLDELLNFLEDGNVLENNDYNDEDFDLEEVDEEDFDDEE